MTKETLTFEGLDATADTDAPDMPDLYGGMHWKNISPFNVSGLAPDSGFRVGAHSGNSVAFNDGGKNGTFSAPHSTFSLKTGYFTAAFDDAHSVTLTAYLDGHVVGVKHIAINDAHQTFAHFGAAFSHIDKVTVQSGNAQFHQVAMDDLKIVFDGHIPSAVHADHAHEMAALFAPDMLMHGTDHWMLC